MTAKYISSRLLRFKVRQLFCFIDETVQLTGNKVAVIMYPVHQCLNYMYLGANL